MAQPTGAIEVGGIFHAIYKSYTTYIKIPFAVHISPRELQLDLASNEAAKIAMDVETYSVSGDEVTNTINGYGGDTGDPVEWEFNEDESATWQGEEIYTKHPIKKELRWGTNENLHWSWARFVTSQEQDEDDYTTSLLVCVNIRQSTTNANGDYYWKCNGIYAEDYPASAYHVKNLLMRSQNAMLHCNSMNMSVPICGNTYGEPI